MAKWYSMQSREFKARIAVVVGKDRGPASVASSDVLFAAGSWLELTSDEAKKEFFQSWLASGKRMPRMSGSGRDEEERAMDTWYDNLRRSDGGREFRQRMSVFVKASASRGKREHLGETSVAHT